MSRVRWTEGIGFTLLCEDCIRRKDGSAYWPLTLEFWDPRSMQRCRACNSAKERRTKRRYRAEKAKAKGRTGGAGE